MIKKEDVAKLAELSLIEVKEDELDGLVSDIDAILAYVGEVAELQPKETTQQPSEVRNVLRDDIVTHEPGVSSETLLAEVSQRDGNHVRVKKIL